MMRPQAEALAGSTGHPHGGAAPKALVGARGRQRGWKRQDAKDAKIQGSDPEPEGPKKQANERWKVTLLPSSRESRPCETRACDSQGPDPDSIFLAFLASWRFEDLAVTRATSRGAEMCWMTRPEANDRWRTLEAGP